MKKVLVMPVLAALLFVGACEDGSDPVTVGPTASVRFFNATTGMAGSGGFTTNGQFTSGSALAFGQSTQTCPAVGAGTTTFGFGAANAGGTALSGNALVSLNNQSLAAAGNFTVVATGSAASPALYLFDNSFSGTLGAGQAAVRFVNLAPGTHGTANTFTVFVGSPFSGGVLAGTDIAVGAPTTFATVASGATEYATFVNGHNPGVSGSAATLDLQAGSVNTIAIVPVAAGGFQLVNLPRCS